VNRTRTIVNFFVVLAFAVCTINAQGASKVSSRKAKSFIKQLEKEHQVSWEQMKEKLSARHEIWVQPENKGVIVKSGVWPFDSSGDLVDLCHLDSIFKFDSRNHLGQVVEAA